MQNHSDGEFLIKLIKHRIEERRTVFGRLNLDTQDRFSRNALYWAIAYQKVDDVKLLLKHGISREIAPNFDAFTYACDVNNQEIIKLLEREEEIPLSA
ncbi:MAG: ankyrin repeat domain-containing protein [Sulfurovaceae bacterium]|nr:ankyrin repeat domain-containing protein [Sulfurovaceae bacterium]